MSETPKAVSNVKRSEKITLQNKKSNIVPLGIASLALTFSTVFSQPSFAQPKADVLKGSQTETSQPADYTEESEQKMKLSEILNLVDYAIDLYKQNKQIDYLLKKTEKESEVDLALLPEYNQLFNLYLQKKVLIDGVIGQLGAFPSETITFDDSKLLGYDAPVDINKEVPKRRASLEQILKQQKSVNFVCLITDINDEVIPLGKKDVVKLVKSGSPAEIISIKEAKFVFLPR